MANLFVNNLTVLDFSFLHPKRGMVGESWIVDLELGGDLNPESMVMDFGIIKKSVKKTLDEFADHKLLLPKDSGALEISEQNDQISLLWKCHSGEIHMRSPKDAILLVPGNDITKATLTLALHEEILKQLPDNINDLHITLREEDFGTSPYYHYSHGLKKHDGNCQRIAHGHRSGIEITENGRRSRYWEKIWTDRWEDIYIASSEDLEGTYFIDEIPHHRFRYEAKQGLFELLIPEDLCYLINEDSTVENLAEHIAEELASEAPGKHFKVRAFEGVEKGALAERGTLRI